MTVSHNMTAGSVDVLSVSSTLSSAITFPLMIIISAVKVFLI